MHPGTFRDSVLMWSLPIIAPIIATLISWWLSPSLPGPSFVMIYLSGVLLTSMSTRVRPAILCALLSFLAYNFFHTTPQFTFFMANQEDILTACLFVLVALVTGHLAARLKEKVVSLEISNQWHLQQIEMAKEFSGCVDHSQVVNALVNQVDCYFQVPINVQHLPTESLDQFVNAGAAEAESREALLSDAPLQHYGDEHYRYILLKDSRGYFSSVELDISSNWSAWQQTKLEALLGLVRLAWDRVRLESELRQETIIKEREQLRSALLSSISHDLRTPLATMIGSVSSVIDLHDALTPEQRRELLNNTLFEAQRLDRYIQKLLDMTRLEHGELTLERDWVGIDDIFSAILKRVKPFSFTVTIKLDALPELPLLHVHPALFEQALFNVVENAIRFAPQGSVINICTHREEQQLFIDVHDDGPGIPENSWASIFDMFVTFSYGDQFAGGTGLGLTICQGIMDAHGGGLHVLKSGPKFGTTIRLTIPLPQPELTAGANE